MQLICFTLNEISILKFIDAAFHMLKIELLLDIDMATSTSDTFVYNCTKLNSFTNIL
jgi:hypothetical protein